MKYALNLPEAWEDKPWEEDSVAKVRKKIFAFFGNDEPPIRISLKLPASRDAALSIEGATPTAYGLGKAGWVSIPLAGVLPPEPILREWIEESYRAVAPKTLAAKLTACVRDR